MTEALKSKKDYIKWFSGLRLDEMRLIHADFQCYVDHMLGNTDRDVPSAHHREWND